MGNTVWGGSAGDRVRAERKTQTAGFYLGGFLCLVLAVMRRNFVLSSAETPSGLKTG
jgi:hypothetical protein